MPNAISRFEQSFAQWLGVRHAFAFWKGRVAWYAILRAIGVGEGDEVILPGYTCVMDVNPITYVSAKPVYVDIEPITYNIDANLLEEKITPKTKVIVAQHTYGYPCDMDRIMHIAHDHGISVVEDCCLALGSRYRDKVCGTFGVAAYFSFQWNKPFTTGIGGMVVTNDAHLAARIQALCRDELIQPTLRASTMLLLQRAVYRAVVFPRTTALITNIFRWLTRKGLVIGSSSTCEYVPSRPDRFFMGMSAAQAGAGLRQMRHLEKNMSHRRHMGKLYDQLLESAGMEVPEIPDYVDPVLVFYPFRVADKKRALAEASHHLVQLGSWFECPLHPIETPMHLYDYHDGMCPVAENACREVVNLPTHLRAGEATARRTVEFIQNVAVTA